MALSKILNASVTDSTLTTTKLATPNLGRRNIVINGAMQVAQRATSATGVGSGFAYPTLDRFKIVPSTSGRATMSQSTDAPDGFANSLKLECTTADTSIAAGEYFNLRHSLEGQNVQQLKKGTSSAEKVTVSFYVKGNASATYLLELSDQDNTRYNGQTFAVTTSWNRIVLTYNGDTSGVLDNDNARSLDLNFWIHGGSTYTGGTFTSNTWHGTDNQRLASITSFFDSTDRTLFITGLQMEVSEQATPFEHRSFGEELALCQRYLQKYTGVTAIKTFPHTSTLHSWNDNNASNGMVSTTTTMRAAPTITESGLRLRSNNHGNFDGTFAFESITVDGAHTAVSGASGLNTGRFYNISSTNTSSYIQLDAEL